ncbi:MAG: xylosidase, partial [Fibrobacteria bacterium]|nr:xylosidase [Fibrobacteria bacterium]
MKALFFVIAISACLNATAQTSEAAKSITGKSICGYQAWFTCAGDGGLNYWRHWGTPKPGSPMAELFPDISDYEESSLFQTELPSLGNGQPSKLFSSWKEETIDKHFEWMKTYGIDGIALQRFVADILNPKFKPGRDSITARVMRAAEKQQRIFYNMYDISGTTTSNLDSMKNDWSATMIGKFDITSSPYYAHQDGKPVICIWGMGFTDRAGEAAQCLSIINWFKQQGCYVIGGVPTNWRTSSEDSKPGFLNVYKAFDMISPWSVGRFGTIAEANTFNTTYIVPDKAVCDTNGIAYQPVVFPGFAWSKWNDGPPNQIPRNKGQFVWRQVYNIANAGITSCYFAMFDEYDESTALMKTADSYFT